MTIAALTLSKTRHSLSESDISNLNKAIKGRVIQQTDQSFDEERKVWNSMIDRRPAFIVQCENNHDVVEAVKFANKHQLLLSVRGAGHNIAGRALEDDVMLIDLSRMRDVVVDEKTQTVKVSPGATLGDLDKATQAFGLAVPVGINSTTGISGLTLGGGFGWLSRKYGMTVDNLLEADVVTVDGDCIKCDANHHPDMFWALRGGGGNFGIVTQFNFQAQPVGPEVLAGPVVFLAKDNKAILSQYRELCKMMPEDLSVWAVLRHAPPLPFLDEKYVGEPVLILASLYCGDKEAGKPWLDKIANLGSPIGNAIGPHSFIDFQSAFDPLLVPGARNYWKSHNFKEISDGLIDVIAKANIELPSTQSEIFLGQMGGATNRVHPDATAYPHRDINFIMNVHTRWDNEAEDEQCINWARKLFQNTKPFSAGGVYVNFVSEGDDDLTDCYGKNIQRLAEIKSKYDPKNVLRTNLNIAPD